MGTVPRMRLTPSSWISETTGPEKRPARIRAGVHLDYSQILGHAPRQVGHSLIDIGAVKRSGFGLFSVVAYSGPCDTVSLGWRAFAGGQRHRIPDVVGPFANQLAIAIDVHQVQSELIPAASRDEEVLFAERV